MSWLNKTGNRVHCREHSQTVLKPRNTIHYRYIPADIARQWAEDNQHLLGEPFPFGVSDPVVLDQYFSEPDNNFGEFSEVRYQLLVRMLVEQLKNHNPELNTANKIESFLIKSNPHKPLSNIRKLISHCCK